MTIGARLAVGIAYRGPFVGAEGDDTRFVEWLERHRTLGVVELTGADGALPGRTPLRRWLGAAPPGFVFDVEAFRALSCRAVATSSLPRDVRRRAPGRERVRIRDLSGPAQYALWERFRESLEPAREAQQLGAVVFRYPRGFRAGPEAEAQLALLPERLPHDRVAVELADPSWTADAAAERTRWLLDHLGISLVTGPTQPPTPIAGADGAECVAVCRIAAGNGHDGSVDRVLASLGSLDGWNGTVHLIVGGERSRASGFAEALAARVSADGSMRRSTA